MNETDGSLYWCVNGESLKYIGYHFKHDITKFYTSGPTYDWGGEWKQDEEGRELATRADIALSILADYFEENPTEGQLRQGTCKCWEYHMDFRGQLWNGEITSDAIAKWIKSIDEQYFTEGEIMEKLACLPIAISFIKDNENYKWSFMHYNGVNITFSDTVEAILKKVIEIMMYVNTDMKGKLLLKGSEEDLVRIAVKWYKAGFYEETIEVCQEALALNRNCIKAYCGIAKSLANLQEYEKALKIYEKALKIEETRELYEQRGDIYYGLGNYAYASNDYLRALAIDPNNEKLKKKKEKANEYVNRVVFVEKTEEDGMGSESIDYDYEKEKQAEEYYGYIND